MMRKEIDQQTKNIVTELVFILDKSGSMAGMESDTIGGFNALIAKQKEESGEAFVTTVLFDSTITTIHDRINIKEVGSMTEKEYQVGGCTALVDAIGTTIDHIGDIHKYIRKEDVPQKTIFVITTDGMENASKQYSSKKVKKMIEAKKESSWEFIFLAANIDAVETAHEFGIDEKHAVNYECSKGGTRKLYRTLECAISELRAEKELSANWADDIEIKKKHR